MEIKAQLIKPYTEEERLDFIVEYNHNQGFLLKETEDALLALDYTEKEKLEKEQQRISMISLTGADVERGIYKAKGMDFEDIIALVTQLQPEGLDIKALKIELRANNFYRGNPYVDIVGNLLGFTKEQLDDFFITNDFSKLVGGVY